MEGCTTSLSLAGRYRATRCALFRVQGDIWHGDWLGIVELTVDLAFLFDIYLNFRCAIGLCGPGCLHECGCAVAVVGTGTVAGAAGVDTAAITTRRLASSRIQYVA